MFLYQLHCPMLKRNGHKDGWITLIKFENEQEALHVFNRKFEDGRKREQRIIAA